MFVADVVAPRMVGYILRSPLRMATELPIYHHAAQGMIDYLARQHVRTVYLGAEGDLVASELRDFLHRHQQVLGLVCMGAIKEDFANEIATCGKPIAFVAASPPGLWNSVMSNYLQAGEFLVDHLYQNGHRNFGWIGNRFNSASLARHKNAFVRALSARGLRLESANEVDMAEGHRQDGNAAARLLLARGRQGPTAVVCFNAMMARATINVAFQRGMRVPQDLSVAAIDMTQVCVEEEPFITSASALPEALGSRAAELVLTHGSKAEKGLCEVVLPSRLVVRDSTGPAPEKSKRSK